MHRAACQGLIAPSAAKQYIVATSDYTEQHVAFAQGALRMSARELLIEWKHAKGEVRKRLEARDRESLPILWKAG